MIDRGGLAEGHAVFYAPAMPRCTWPIRVIHCADVLQSLHSPDLYIPRLPRSKSFEESTAESDLRSHHQDNWKTLKVNSHRVVALL